MSRARGPSRSDEEDDLDDAEDDEEAAEPPRRRRPLSPRRSRDSRRGPPRRWRGPADGEDEEEDEEEVRDPPPTWRGSGPRKRFPVFWRARDSLYFEPLVGLAIIVVLLVSLFAYTGNWPPVYVVESNSMQHGSSDVLGLINTGDLVLAQKVSTTGITTYVVGLTTGYSTYGEYGDVLLYYPNGDTGATPIIHRAILYLQWNAGAPPGGGSYSAPELANLPCGGPNAVYATPGTPGNCGATDLTGALELFHIGWRSATVNISDLSAPALGGHSGYLTMGDGNVNCSGSGSACTGEPDQGGASVPQISTLVEPGWIIGVARGMVPWFGALKLLLVGNTVDVPAQSWQFLGLTIAGVILLAFGIHFALRVEGIETPLRKEEDEETRAAHEESESREDRPTHHWFRSSRRSREEEDDEDELEPAPTHSHRSPATERARATIPARRSRPRPKVRRPARHRRDDDL